MTVYGRCVVCFTAEIEINQNSAGCSALSARACIHFRENAPIFGSKSRRYNHANAQFANSCTSLRPNEFYRASLPQAAGLRSSFMYFML